MFIAFTCEVEMNVRECLTQGVLSVMNRCDTLLR